MKNLFSCSLLFLITASLAVCSPEGGSVVVLSSKVGQEINYIENAYYNIFPEIPRVWSAQIVLLSSHRYGVKILYLDPETQHLKKAVRTWTPEEFDAMKRQVDLTPYPTREDIQKISGTYILLEQIEHFQKVPPGAPVKIFNSNGKTIKGILEKHAENGMVLNHESGTRIVPYYEINKGYWFENRTWNHSLDKYFYGTVLGAGAIAGYTLFRDNSSPVRYFKSAATSVGFLLVTELIRQGYLLKFPKKHPFEIIWDKDN